MIHYFGDAPLCYSNSLAMVLNAYGYSFSTAYLEALMVMGNGASFIEEDSKHPLVFFDNGLPDRSISNCLNTLGLEYEEFYLEDPRCYNLVEIKDKLAKLLKNGPVVIGPVDLGYLTYNPNSIYLNGTDHFVCLYDMDNDYVYLHDPAGYPNMKMSFKELIKAWEAEAINYKRGSFSMWGNITSLKTPQREEIYASVSHIMKMRYEQADDKVIEHYAHAIKLNGLNQPQKEMHQFYSFRLASARNICMSQFLKEFDVEKANLKSQIAVLFGKAHLDSMKDDYTSLSETLLEISELDEKFKALCLAYKGE